MSTPGSTKALEETFAVFERGRNSREPLTTAEVASELDVSRRSTYARLERLVDESLLASKKVGARGRIWWLPATRSSTRSPTDGTDAPESPVDDVSLPDGRSIADDTSLADEVLDNADVGVIIFDENRQVAWINRATEQYFGLDRASVIGRDEGQFVRNRIGDAVADPETLTEQILGAPDGDTSTERREYRVTTSGDRPDRWLRYHSEPLESGSDAGDRIDLFYDVTEQKQAKRASRTALQQFDSVVEAVENYAILLLDAAGNVRTWNRGAERITGYDERAILGAHVSTFYEESARERRVPERTLARAARDGSTETAGWRVRSDGTQFWAQTTVSAVREAGELVGFTTVVRDMTEQRAYKRELQRERDFSRQVLETAPAYIFVVDDTGDVVETNDRLWYELDLNEDFEDLSVGDLPIYDETGSPVPPEDRPYWSVFETGTAVSNWEGQIGLPSGERRWMSFNVAPVRTEDGDVAQVVVALQDVTRLKEQAQQLERQRDEVETELEEVYTRIDDAFLAIDANWQITYVNDKATDILGIPAEDLLGIRMSDALPEVTAGQPRALAERAFEDQETVEFEFHAESLDRWLEIRLYPSESGLSAYFRDVTERKHREQALEESRRRYRTLVDNFPNGAVALVDQDLRYVTFGGTPVQEQDGPEQVGPEQGFEGSHVTDVLPAELEATVRPRYEAALDGESATFESEFGGQCFQFRFIPVRNDDGDVVAALGLSQDVTEQKERERELRQAKAQLEAAAEAGDVGTWEWHADEDRIVGGPSFARIFGLDPSVAREGVSTKQIIPTIHEDDRERFVEATQEAIESCSEFECEYRVREHDGDVRWVVSRGTVECDESGRPVRFPGALTDITERKRVESALEFQREQLAALNNVNEVVRTITEAVIDQSTHEEIEQVVCDGLAESESYLSAWTGSVDFGSKAVSVDAHAGFGSDFEDVTVTVDPADPRGEGPPGRALRTGEIQTTQDAQTDDRSAPWRDRIERHGVRSSASIPMVHDGTIFGLLNVYADRPDAFEGEERTVIGQLGEVVGHAIAAVERKRALMSDELVELEFQIPNVFEELDVDADPTGVLELHEAVPIRNDDYLVYGHATAPARESLLALVDGLDHWQSVRFHDEAGDSRFELQLSEPPILSTLASLGGSIENVEISDRGYHMTLCVSPGADVRRLIESVRTVYPTAEMVARRQITRRDDGDGHVQRVLAEDLTERQRTALRVAYHAGFFAWPRRTTGEDLADVLGVAPPTFHQHLRKAEQKVFDRVFSGSGGSG